MLVNAGSPRAMGVHGFSGETRDDFLDFDSVDRRLAAMAAAGFVQFIAVVVVWMWLS